MLQSMFPPMSVANRVKRELLEDLRFTEVDIKVFIRKKTLLSKEEKDWLTTEIGSIFTEIIRNVEHKGWGMNDIQRFFAQKSQGLPIALAM